MLLKHREKLHDLKHYAQEVSFSNVFATKPGIKWLSCVQFVLGQKNLLKSLRISGVTRHRKQAKSLPIVI